MEWAVAALLIPFGASLFAAGAIYARWAIVKRPAQVGLRRL